MRSISSLIEEFKAITDVIEESYIDDPDLPTLCDRQWQVFDRVVETRATTGPEIAAKLKFAEETIAAENEEQAARLVASAREDLAVA